MTNNKDECQKIERQIINLLLEAKLNEAIKRFYEFFSKENPPDCEFASELYLELNKLGCFGLAYEAVKNIDSWSGSSPAIKKLLKNAASINCDHIVLTGNNLLFEYTKKKNRLDETLKQTSFSAKPKVKEENDKILSAIAQKALNLYIKAHNILKTNIAAIEGLIRCYELLGDSENAAQSKSLLKEATLLAQKKIDDAKNSARLSEEALKEEAINKAKLEQQRLINLERLLDKKHYARVVVEADKIMPEGKAAVVPLLLKARALAKLRRFNEAEAALKTAERQKTNVQKCIDAKAAIDRLKHRLLASAAQTYLRHAIKLGPVLGKGYFIKAQSVAKRAIELEESDINTLDCLYAAQKYLGLEKEAYDTKVLIYAIDRDFTPTFSKEAAKSMCFIASYAYEGQEKIIDEFRAFRRGYLLESALGLSLNRAYVCISPRLVGAMRPCPVFKPISRVCLTPFRVLFRILNFLFHK